MLLGLYQCMLNVISVIRMYLQHLSLSVRLPSDIVLVFVILIGTQ